MVKDTRDLFDLLFLLGCTVNVQRMMGGTEIVKFAGCLDDFIDPGITEFYDFPGIHVYEVIMLHAMIGLLELGNVLAELVLNYQVAVKQQLDGIV